MDEYADFRSLSAAHPENTDFRVRVRAIEGCTIIVAAPHGGGIEPGTSEIAEAIAGADLAYCTFDGVMRTGNGRLHITSTRFDEPRCIQAVRSSVRVLTIHGEGTGEQIAFAGGRDIELVTRLTGALSARGFDVRTHSDPALQGDDPANLCNRGRTGAGAQLELSAGLRRTFFHSLTAAGRRKPLPRLKEFVSAVRAGLLEQPPVHDER